MEEVRLRSPSTPSRMHHLQGHRRPVRAVAYAPGTTPLLVSAGDDQDIRVWDPVAGREITLLQNRREGILSLAFTPDGTQLATGGHAGTLMVWDMEVHEVQLWMGIGLSPIVGLAYSSDGQAVLSGLRSQRYGGEPGRLLCMNLRPIRPFVDVGWVGEVESVAFAPARDLFAVARLDRGVELWEVGRPQRDPVAWMPVRVRALCFSPGAADLLAVATGRMIQIWNVVERRWGASCKGHRADVSGLAFSPDGRLLLSGGADRSVRLWETHTGRALGAWDWQLGAIHAVAVASDGMTAACGGEKPGVVVWDLDDC